LLAEKLRVSGVLSVVTAGLYLGRRMPELLTFQTRLRGGPVWEIVEFILNGLVFILIGLQLPEVLRAVSASGRAIPVSHLFEAAFLISLLVVLIRMLWVFPAAYLPRLLFKSIRARDPYPSWQQLTLLGWTGMRGVVSLAAALAIPEAMSSGAPFPGRELIVLLTFVVILVTLVVQGLSLPFLIRRLGLKDDGSIENEELEARLQANRAALARLNRLAEDEPAKIEALSRLKMEYEDHIRQVEGAAANNVRTSIRLFSSEYEKLSHEALLEERRTILELRNRGVINDEVLRRIQRDIDLAEARLRNHQS